MSDEVQPSEEAATDELRPELQPIADKYGREMFDAALRIASLTSACDQLLHRTRTSATLHALVGVVVSSLGDLNNDLIAANGWELEAVVECIREIGQAKQDSMSRIVSIH